MDDAGTRRRSRTQGPASLIQGSRVSKIEIGGGAANRIWRGEEDFDLDSNEARHTSSHVSIDK